MKETSNAADVVDKAMQMVEQANQTPPTQDHEPPKEEWGALLKFGNEGTLLASYTQYLAYTLNISPEEALQHRGTTEWRTMLLGYQRQCLNVGYLKY